MLIRQDRDFSLRNFKGKNIYRAEQLAEGLKVKECTEKAVFRGHEAIKVINEQEL